MTSPTSPPLYRSDAETPLRVLLVMRRFVGSFSQLPYLLSRAGMQVEVIGSHWVSSLRQCAPVVKFIEIPFESADFSRELAAHVANEKYDFVLVVDEPALSSVQEGLAEHPSLASCLSYSLDSPLAAVMGSKADFYSLCQQHDIPLPATEMVDSVEAAEGVALRFGFPCILKGTTGSGGETVFILHDRDELSRQLKSWKCGFPIIVQQYIEGPVVGALFFAYEGEMRAWMAITKDLALNGGKGPAVVSRFLYDDSIRQALEKFARLGNYTGITGLDFMQAADGSVYVIDPHFGRITPFSHFGVYCGVDFGVALRDALLGKITVQNPQPSEIIAVKFPECVEFAIISGFWKLMRAAPPFSKRTRYCLTPALGWKFNLKIFLGAVELGLRLRTKKLRATVARARGK